MFLFFSNIAMLFSQSYSQGQVPRFARDVITKRYNILLLMIWPFMEHFGAYENQCWIAKLP